MPSVLLKNVRVYRQGLASISRRRKTDVFIKNGILESTSFQGAEPRGCTTIDCEGAVLLPGFVDVGALVGEPGFEHRETLDSACAAAAAGGYVAIAPFPNSNPIIQHASDVRSLARHSERVTSILPIAAASADLKGNDLSDMLELADVGAVAFSDGIKPITNTGFLMRALQYSSHTGKAVIQSTTAACLVPDGQMHEGVQSTMLGLRGKPVAAELMNIKQALDVLRYAGGRLHLCDISSSAGVELIRQAKKEGLNLTASCQAINLAFTDEALATFDSDYKVNPPLRSEGDRLALAAGLEDGTLDCLMSGHRPLHLDEKRVEFPYADFGTLGLQTAISTALTFGQLSLDALVRSCSTAPRKLLDLPAVQFKEGDAASYTLLDLNNSTTLTKENNQSHSTNSPFFGIEMTGHVKAVINADRFEIF